MEGIIDMNSEHAEKNTVDRAIEIEIRMEQIDAEMEQINDEANYWHEWSPTYHRLIEKLDELGAELSDLQREYRG